MEGPTVTSTAPIETVYDAFAGPDLDLTRWMYLERPLPDGTLHRSQEPNATFEVSEGTLSISIDEFQTSHDTLQSVDNAKHMLFTTAEFPMPESGSAVYEIQQSVRRSGAPHLDDLFGLAAFNIMDFTTGLVFDVAVGNRHVFAIHEQFDTDPMAPPLFTHMVESPFRMTTQPGKPHTLRMTFDTTNHVVTWAVDGAVIYYVEGTPIPRTARIGLSLLTGVKLTEQGSASLQGQGISATWSAPTIKTTSRPPATH